MLSVDDHRLAESPAHALGTVVPIEELNLSPNVGNRVRGMPKAGPRPARRSVPRQVVSVRAHIEKLAGLLPRSPARGHRESQADDDMHAQALCGAHVTLLFAGCSECDPLCRMVTVQAMEFSWPRFQGNKRD